MLRTLATCRRQPFQKQDGRCAVERMRGRAGRRAHSGCGVAWCRARAALQRRRARARSRSQASCSAFGSTTGQHTCRATPTAAAAFRHMPESDSATRCAPTHGRARDCPRGAALAAPLLRLLRCATAASRLTGLSPTSRLHLSPTPLARLSPTSRLPLAYTSRPPLASPASRLHLSPAPLAYTSRLPLALRRTRRGAPAGARRVHAYAG